MKSLRLLFLAVCCAGTLNAASIVKDLTLLGSLNELAAGATLTINGTLVLGSGSITLQNAAADGTTKGVAAFAAADFNASSGVISIDYTNGQAANGSTKGFLTAADWTTFNAKGNAQTANPLSQFAATTSAQLAGVLSDETGTGVAVFGTSPTFTTQITTPKVVFASGPQDLTGTGSPEGAVTAAVGSTYRRTDGGTTTTLYVKESGSGNTGWVAAGAGGGGSGSITASGYTQNTARLLGRTTASSGAIEEITVGTGLSLSAGTLTATGGSGGTKTLMRWGAADNQPPTTNYATLDTRNSILVLDFDETTAESAVFFGIIPEAADFTTGIKVRLVFTATSATSGNVIFTSYFERGNTDLDSDSFATGVDSAATATSGTSGIPTIVSIDHSGSQIDGLVAGEFFRIAITRKAADGGDTMTGDAELIAVEIQQR